MQSATKIALTDPDLRRAARACFGSRAGLRDWRILDGGFFGSAALLELEDGSRWVLKAAPPPGVRVLRYERDLLRAEVQALRLVRAQTDVPVAEVIWHDESGAILPAPYFIMSELPGRPLNLLGDGAPADARREAVMEQVGGLARKISSLRGESFGYLAQPCPSGTPWRACFAAMLDEVLRDGADAGVRLPVDEARLRDSIARRLPALDALREPRLVHWDLWDGNVFVEPASGRVTGLIDFERALWGDPLMEAPFADLDPNSPFARGFGQTGLDTPDGRVRRLLYNAYLYLIMVIECAYRRYPDDWQLNWAGERLRETAALLEQTG